MERKIKLTPIKTESTSQDASGKKTYLDLANALVDAWNRINPPGTVFPRYVSQHHRSQIERRGLCNERPHQLKSFQLYH